MYSAGPITTHYKRADTINRLVIHYDLLANILLFVLVFKIAGQYLCLTSKLQTLEL